MEKKIRKNLSDSEMFANSKEQLTFENDIQEDSVVPAKIKKAAPQEVQQSLNSSLVTPELQEKIGKALLELKLALYKQGIVEYKIKVSSQGDQIILKADPVRESKK